MKSISITVPMDYQALTQAAGMFRGLAETMAPPEATAERPDVETENTVETLKEEAEVNIPSPTPGPEAKAVEVFAQPLVTPTPENVLEPLANMTAAEEAPFTEVGTNLDVNGLPWDGRIHASTKTKTVNGAWKNKRGVDKEVLAQVETELKGVMAIPTPGAVAEVAPTPAPVTEIPPAAPGGITTFPALMTAITANSISPEVVLGAVQAVGLQSFPLLAARTDLIPQVAERLGL